MAVSRNVDRMELFFFQNYYSEPKCFYRGVKRVAESITEIFTEIFTERITEKSFREATIEIFIF